MNPAQSLSTEEIASRAYRYYEEEGRQDGRATEHWLRAEAELRAERGNGNGNGSKSPERGGRNRKKLAEPSHN